MAGQAHHIDVHYKDGSQERLEGNFFLAWKLPEETRTLCEIDMTVVAVANFFLETFRSLGNYLGAALDQVGSESEGEIVFERE